MRNASAGSRPNDHSFNKEDAARGGVDVVAVVPDFDDTAVFEAEGVDDRDLVAAAEEFHPEEVGFVFPLPAGGGEVALGDLVIDGSGHGAAVPEISGDLLLPCGNCASPSAFGCQIAKYRV
jgi:hypothetical protein